MTTAEAQHYVTAFRARVEYCRALEALSAEQQSLIAAAHYTNLLELLQHKQQLIDALLNPEGSDADLWQSWRSDRNRLNPADRRACERLLEEADGLLRSVMTSEDQCADDLTSQRDATQAALHDINHGGLAAVGYQPESELPTSRRLDLDL